MRNVTARKWSHFLVACAEYLISNNVEVPVFSSLNCDGTEERNDKLFKKYTRMY